MDCCSVAALKLATLNANSMYTNHTTKQFTTLPTLGFGSPRPVVHGVNFTFNPTKSPHYKVMCVQSSDFSSEHYQIKIYSSNTGPWRVSGQPFTAHVNIQFNGGVYWNDAIHWLSIRGDPLCFDVDKKCLQIMPMPPLPSGYDRRWFNYFGESGDHLHLIERDDSNQNNCRALEFLQLCYTFGCRRETTDGGESSFMVLHINGKVMRYSFEDKSLKKLCDFAASAPGRPVSFGGRRLCFPFIEVDQPICDRAVQIILGLLKKLNEMEAQLKRRTGREETMDLLGFVMVGCRNMTKETHRSWDTICDHNCHSKFNEQ
ncbi:F-box protein At5g07610-like [Camellia sinensis]|uniref:F-box protein At5g07610-like n=1 Tax=Camellia sinensis TaxID=4442 RepID=UPI001035C9AE|nr:F-box protein At5g07610-like [Camellia sinensis]